MNIDIYELETLLSNFRKTECTVKSGLTISELNEHHETLCHLIKQEAKRIIKGYSFKVRKLLKQEDDPIKAVEIIVLSKQLSNKNFISHQKGAVKI